MPHNCNQPVPVGERGFSLMEVLVAFAVLAIVMGAVLQVFSGGLRNLKVGGDISAAATWAESHLARLGRDLEVVPGVQSGEADGLRWEERIEPYAAIDASALEGGALYEVTLSVYWGAFDRPRSFQLSTLRYVPNTEGAL